MHRLRSFLARARVPGALVALGMLAAACTEVPAEIKSAAAVECPSGSACYDPVVPEGPGGAVTVEGGEFFFEIVEGEETVQAGAIEVTFENVGNTQHNLTIDEATSNESVPEGDTDLPGGETATATLELFAGTYTYYCSVPGHRSAGMEGTLTVNQAGTVEVTAAPSPTDTSAQDEPQEGEASPGEPGPEGSPVEPVPEGPAEDEAVDDS